MEQYTEQAQSAKVEELYMDTKLWKSQLRFTDDEMHFIDHLLNSYVFEPNTPNLFERLRDYQDRLQKTVKNRKEVTDRIRHHENNLGGMLECMDEACDMVYYQEHEQLKAEVTSFQENFRYLKREIFQYAGGILKKRKPFS